MNYTRLNTPIDDGVGHIELAAPDEFNRMPPAFWEEFPAAVLEMDASGSVRALVISAQGKHFSSGMDTSVFTEAAPRKTLMRADGANAPDATLQSCKKRSQRSKRFGCRY
ncbi:MAG: hypothetical protein CM1200mP9_09650 [Gammaproteobacteria bacterium]|nr:MAG: hypothetical protein CM1200mP9_09650 [Gammaproteobacteria bacterium]